VGKYKTDGDELGTVNSGSLTAVGASPWCAARGRTNLFLTGPFVGEARFEASFDGGATVVPVTLADSTVRTFTGPDRLVFDEPERGILYRVACTKYTSGTIKWRMSQ